MLRQTIAAAFVSAALTSAALAQLTVAWSTIDAGGISRANSGTLTVGFTLGQPDAASLTGGSFKLTAGFWPGAFTDCLADVDDGSFTGIPDGGVTIDDLLYYLFVFEQGLLTADLDDGSSTGTPDGGVTIDDLLYFLVRFEAGC